MKTILVALVFLYGLAQGVRSPQMALLLYLWVANFRPVEWAHNTLNYFSFSLVAGGLLLFSTALYQRKFSLNRIQLLVILFGIQAGISTHYSLAPAYSEHWFKSYFVVLVGVVYLISVIVDDLDKFRVATMVFAVSLGIEGAKQGIVGTLTNPGVVNVNALPHLGDNNGVAVGMLMILPILVYLYHEYKERLGSALLRWFLVVMSIGVLLRAITTYSRGILLTMVVLGLIFVLRGQERFKKIVIGTVLIVSMLAVMPEQYWDRMETVKQAWTGEGLVEASAASRPHLWKVAGIAGNDRPWTGVGFNAFTSVYTQYDISEGKFGTEGKAAHGTLPGVFADTGYPGLILFVALIWSAWRSMRKIQLYARFRDDMASLGRFALAMEYSLLAFLIGGTFLSYMYYEVVWTVFGFCAALTNIARRQLAAGRQVAIEPVEAPLEQPLPRSKASNF